jgi:4-amino-4-deoxy-L-arabinose transferase-like glycosyltransferase
MPRRLADYAVLVAVLAAVALPHLGTPSLWDVDEGVNAGCTREMMEAGTWVVPTFNWELRTAKPVMLYWLQRPAFHLFGVNEWAARLPAVLCSLGTVLLVYELGRRAFGAAVGLLAGVILATAIEFCKLAHAATPDAPLVLFTTLAFYLFWVGHEGGRRRWWLSVPVACGLAALTKGPVGVALPGLVILLYFAWNRELGRLLDRRLLSAAAIFLLVAAPWYGLVIAETRGAYLAFFRDENANRFLNPMEGHRGPVVYYLGALLVFFAPWCAFLGGAVWYGAKDSQRPPSADGGLSPEARACRFLLCWVGAYLVFFSAAATKLPNYIAPLYPAAALLTARFLVRWRDGTLAVPGWLMPAACGGTAVVGLAVGVGLLVVGGVLPVPAKGLRVMPELAPWAALGLIPVAAGGAMIWRLHAGDRAGMIRAAAVAAVLFVGLTAAFPAVEADGYKAPKRLVADSGAADPTRELRLGSLDYTQPSVTFYAGRRVDRLASAADAETFLAMPLPAYLFVPEPVWAGRAGPWRVAARRFDLYRNCHVLVVTNEL